MEQIASRTSLIDLHHQGHPSVIAAALLELEAGVAIVDPGPTSAIDVLRETLAKGGVGTGDIRALFLTHIHLDHAGASGSLVRENPNMQVFVHPRGAPHLVDPSRLIKSAARLFGDSMDRLWGTCLPVPEANVRALADGEGIDAGGRPLEVAYTPGHASHHAAFYDAHTGIAFVGDAAGGRIRDQSVILPATPPPDIDLDAIIASFERIQAWEPERMFLTHFGPATRVEEHGGQLRERLASWAEHVRRSLEDNATDDARCERFVEWVGADLRRVLDASTARSYELGAAADLSWRGLARYWRKNS